MRNSNKSNPVKRWIFFLTFMLVIPLAKSVLVMLLWNALMPDLVHLAPINFWQALGLFILCKLLFGNFGFGRRDSPKRHFGPPRFREKFIDMSPEEREKLKEKWKERCQK